MNGSADEIAVCVRRHLKIGWWSLSLFLCLGVVLETMHGFKVAWYVNVDTETRRLMWRLAHAHGAFLGLVHIAFAATLFLMSSLKSQSAQDVPQPSQKKQQKKSKRAVAVDIGWYLWASQLLTGASIALPGVFFLRGTVVRGGDPGLGILVLTVGGALLLLLAVLSVARGVTQIRL